jgi:large-conductance mechanosensitive channel
MGQNLRRIWMLFMWTHLVAKLLKFLVLAICLFSLQEPIPNVPKKLKLHSRDHRV